MVNRSFWDARGLPRGLLPIVDKDVTLEDQLSHAAHEHRYGHWDSASSRFGLVIRVSSSTMLLSISSDGKFMRE